MLGYYFNEKTDLKGRNLLCMCHCEIGFHFASAI
jgi:hypothetical protein